MSGEEYTPTTEDVRFGYANDMSPGRTEGAGQGFDRWLAAHDREVAEWAWDEGAHASFIDPFGHNPYRRTS